LLDIYSRFTIKALVAARALSHPFFILLAWSRCEIGMH